MFAALIMLTACLPWGGGVREQRLRVGLLPILDTLPFYVAEQRGYFQVEGVTVELVPVKGAQERDALMQAGEIDGMLTDLVAVGLFNREKAQLHVIATALRATPDAAMFRVLAAPESTLRTVQDLAGVTIAISQNTIIEYVTERLLTTEGLTRGQIQTLEVSAIPVRYEQLMAGQVQAATLPDPLASGAIAGGAHLIVDDTRHSQYSQTVLAFSHSSVEGKPEAVRGFLRAWNRAVDDLNSRPADFADLLIEKGRVPDNVRGTFRMPPFPKGDLPSSAEWEDVMRWMVEKGLLDRALPYAETVLSTFRAR
jgi:NitT/TauT family transport system substrate-binding protein